MPHLTQRDLHWFELANAGSYAGKKSVFYPFKTRFLKRFGSFMGYARQVIEHKCWSCDGTGNGFHGACGGCVGTGIYKESYYYLECWQLGAQIYHRPVEFSELPVPEPIYIQEITGKIVHQEVHPRASYRAMMRLLLRHEPVTYTREVMLPLRNACSYHRWKLELCLIRLRNKLDLFPAINVDDDIPF